MKADELIIGKKYYFDDVNEDYGELVSNDGSTLEFKVLEGNTYTEKSNGIVEFSARGKWRECVEE